ncbi:MAG TPA: protein kinase [Kofleriaceae bacterium]|nr:protein kinase [Kofleriaceae bacterium]
MAHYWCQSCNQFYPEPGYCPFDGNKLVAASAQVTAPSDPPTGPSGGGVRSVSAHEGGAGAAAAAFKPADPNAEYDRLVGQTLDGRYFIERKIGEGGMGVVFAARHAIIERPLAIKVLKKEVARDSATIKRFVQEAKAASRIGHPNIVDVTDFGTTPDGLTYSTMEYVDGQTLSAAIKTTAPFKLARALPIVAQIARALGAAHAKGIVHRDLKPENIFLVNRDGRRDFVKIVDFGIAKVTPMEGQSADGPRLTRAGAVFGTPEYMAPEQAAGRNDTDGRVDVYALGIILYEMITGKVPHKADSMVRTLAMQMLDPIIPPSQLRPDLALSPAFEGMLMKMLAKKREQRYATMEEVLKDLEGAAGGGIKLEQPVSASVQNIQPAYTVGPLPPGADASALAPARPTIKNPVGVDTPTKGSSPPPAGQRGKAGPDSPTQRDEGPRATSKRVANEPAFVGSGSRPPTYDSLTQDSTQPPPARSKWPLFVALIVIFAGGGVALAVLLNGSDAKVASAPIDAAQVAIPTIDAPAPRPDATQVVIEIPLDAQDELVDGGAPDDAMVATARRDGGVRVVNGRRPDAGVGGPTRYASIQVITKPDEGVLYINDSYRGPSGVTIEDVLGTRARIKCTHPGYEPGFVDVTFDGKTEIVVCVMERVKRCIDGIKNPFDDCPD